MKVFVTGGTGAVGPHAIRALVAAGHEVSAMVRTDDKAAQVARLGAKPVFVSLFDQAALTRAFAGHDAIANLATSIPSTAMYAVPSAWKNNARIRTEGTRKVVDAAIAADVGRVVQESVALTYPDHGADFIDETVPLATVPIMATTPTSEGHIDRFTQSGGAGVVLRFGLFYGPGANNSAEMLAVAKAHMRPVFGHPKRYVSPIHLADAGEAVAAALTAPPGIYNIVDDEPLTKREFGQAICDATGATPWAGGPGRLIGLPGKNMAALARSLRVSNAKFKQATAWKPEFASAREGWQATAKAWNPDVSKPIARLLAALLALTSISTGIWATFAPRSWFQGFPGFGRHWVADYGHYSEHLVTDLGGFYLALSIAALVAAAWGRRGALTVVGAFAAVEAAPHLIFHLIDHGKMSTTDTAATAVLLALQLAIGLALIVLGRREPRPRWAGAGAGSPPPIPGVRRSYVRARGVRFHVTEAGSGTPVLALHGWPQHHYEYRDLLADPPRGLRIIAPDLPGYGWSGPPPDRWRQQDVARDVLALLDELDLDHVLIVGHDWGGWIGYKLALDAPQRVTALLTSSIPHPWIRPRAILPHLWRLSHMPATAAFGMLLHRHTRLTERLIFRYGLADRTALSTDEVRCFADRFRDPICARAATDTYRTFLLREAPALIRRPEQRRATVPIRALLGADDFPVHHSLAAPETAIADDYTLELVPRCGHFLVDEHPDLVRKRLIELAASDQPAR